jgi:hypothetical protein
VQILSGLDSSLKLDYESTWIEISEHVSKDIMPVIDKALHNRMEYNQTELKFVLQQLHRHKRDNWRIAQDSEKLKQDRKRKGTNSHRSKVGFIY